jgi:hypothetical protein
MTMEDLYESLYDEPYKGNPNWAGDDWYEKNNRTN